MTPPAFPASAETVRYVCFLRAINVGGRNVSMAELRKIFESLGLTEVETFIASGNVIFVATQMDTAKLELKISAGLREALGYESVAFLRTTPELLAVVEATPFSEDRVAGAAAFNVAFTPSVITSAQRKSIEAFDTDGDLFRAVGREIYWLCVVKQSESKFSSARMEKVLGVPVTWRGINTVRRLSAKYPPRRP